MSQIHITDGQTDRILDDISARYILSNKHRQSLKDTLETFEFVAIGDKPYTQYLGKHNRVIIPNEDSGYSEFVIHEFWKYRDSEGLKAEVYTSASYLLLKKAKVIIPTKLNEYTPSMYVGWALNDTEWRPGIIEGSGFRTLIIETHTNPYAFLKRVAREFELELRFRVETDGNRITGRYVDLFQRVGDWRGREVEFGRDLVRIKRIEKTDNIYSALIGLGPEREDGTRLEVLIEDEEALLRWGRPNEHGVLQHLIDVYEPESTRTDMTLEELTQYTRTELNKRINAVVEYETDIADLENVPGMENKKIRFGDTIKIKDSKFNPPLYLEARVHTQERDIVDKSKKHVELGDFIEYTEDEVRAIWKSLQAEIRQKVSLLDVLEVTYSKQDIDNKDEGVYQDSTLYSDQVTDIAKHEAIQIAAEDATDKSVQAETNAKSHADQKATEAENNAKSHAEQKAAEAEENAKSYSVSKEVYQAKVAEMLTDLADKAGLDYVDGQLEMKANSSLVTGIYDTVNDLASVSDSLILRVSDNESALVNQNGRITSIVQEIDMIEGTMLITIDELSTIDGKVQNQQVQINAQANAIALKASLDDLDMVSGNVSSLSAEVNIISGKVELKANQSALEHLDGNVTSVSNNLASLTVDVNSINQNVSSLTQTVEGHSTQITLVNSSITQLNNSIEQRVTKTEYQTDQNNLVTRLDSAESRIIQTESEIQQRVTTTTYNSGMSSKEDTVFKQNTAPSHAVGRLWLATNVTPNQLWRSNGSAWVKATPTTASEVGAYSSSEGSALAGRVSTAESTITQHSNLISSKVSQTDFNTLTGRVSTAESTINQHADMISQRVTTTTFTSGLADKENNVLKQNSAPSHLNGRLWLDTSKTPNVLMRSTGSAWVKATPTTASEVGAYSSTDGSALAGRVTTAEGSITTLAGQVQIKANQSDLNTLTNRVSSAESSITANANAINLRVTKTEFDNLQIVGRNLVRYKQTDGSTAFTASQVTLGFDGDVIKGQGNSTNNPSWPRIFNRMVHLIEFDLNGEYTLSFEARTNNPASRMVQLADSNSQNQVFQTNFSYAEEWKRYTHVFKPSRQPSQNAYLQFWVGGSDADTTSWLEIKNIKIEKGNRATDWTPAIEDVDNKITLAESAITQLADQITLRVEKDGVISSINQTAEAIKIQASRIEIDGDLTVINGMVRIKQGIITNSMIATNAAIDFAKITNVQITNAMIENVDASKIKTGKLTAIEIEGVTIRGSVFEAISDTGNEAQRVLINESGARFYQMANGVDLKYLHVVNAGLVWVLPPLQGQVLPRAVSTIFHMEAINEADPHILKITSDRIRLDAKKVFIDQGIIESSMWAPLVLRSGMGPVIVDSRLDINNDLFVLGRAKVLQSLILNHTTKDEERFKIEYYASGDTIFQTYSTGGTWVDRFSLRGRGTGDVRFHVGVASTVAETGYIAMGVRQWGATTLTIIGTGVNFKMTKTYVPSSVSLTTQSTVGSPGTPEVSSINEYGFYAWLSGTSEGTKTWRGTYTA